MTTTCLPAIDGVLEFADVEPAEVDALESVPFEPHALSPTAMVTIPQNTPSHRRAAATPCGEGLPAIFQSIAASPPVELL
jgi:hypothetical protein